MEKNYLDVSDVSKVIKGHIVLDHISMHLESGIIYGIIGQNGAGKTMLYKTLSGLYSQTSGEIRYNGFLMTEKKPAIGLAMDDISFYPYLTGKKISRF